ncbi:zinc-binding dehydrogenase, partial [Actinomycetospora sp.]|uniref:zinc-binding dehydrogenase n=1 Tax=Actinomycetospora sp. TaxID=1872135 RepID=UPI002F3F5F8F
VDPLENKREKAMELGATHAVGSIEEAADLARQMTNGNGADKAVVTAGLVTQPIITGAFDAIGKGGTVVLTGLNKLTEQNVQLPSAIMTLFKKTLKGTLFGDCNPTVDIPKILGLYQSGDIKLDELITKYYTLDQVNEGYDDLLNGKNVRGVLVHEH